MVRARARSPVVVSAQRNSPKITAQLKSDTTTTRRIRAGVNKGCCGGRGGCAIKAAAGGSKANANDIVSEQTMLSHSTCKAVTGSGVARMAPSRIVIEAPPFTGNTKAKVLRRLRYTVRPSSTAASIVAKLSSVSSMSAA